MQLNGLLSYRVFFFCFQWVVLFLPCNFAAAQSTPKNVHVIPVGTGWANNSVNAVVFRKNALVSFEDTQFIGFYNQQGEVVIGKRKSGAATWELKPTGLKGKVNDAHNSISIMVDGAGYLHMAWNHHNSPLQYCRSKQPGSLELTGLLPMTGTNERNVTYPEFYKLQNGNLLFFFRDGGSGNGNLVLNHYDVASGRWNRVQNNVVDGEGKRNAYWQACADAKGVIHLSWVWRETPDVASNHDMCYARSKDGGKTWEKSTGEKYRLPITVATAEYAWQIPQQSELINQTSMTTDEAGNPFIATYWRNKNDTVPQYHIIYHDGSRWQDYAFRFRRSAFTLSGGGSKRIPIARPQLLVKGVGHKAALALIFRDAERQNKVSVATVKNMRKGGCKITDLTAASVGQWEPSYDTELWKQKQRLHLFVQRVEQADAEGLEIIPPQMVQVLEAHLRF